MSYLRLFDALPRCAYVHQLEEGEHGIFRTYNPTLYVKSSGELMVVARYSNYNFCSQKKNFEANLREVTSDAAA